MKKIQLFDRFKNLVLLLVGFAVMFSCNQNKGKKHSEKDLTSSEVQNFDWLLGKWKQTNNEEEGNTTFENWVKTNQEDYFGRGFTLSEGDTIQNEEMKLMRNKKGWKLLVKTANENQFTEFVMTEFTHSSFVCVNDTIDFPKRIYYRIENNQLKAEISNDDMNIPFDFERQK